MLTGTTFNDKAAGPLHLGPANCSYAFILVGNDGKNRGFCTFSDADGDKIFTEATGTNTADGNSNGTNEIIGTGKYDGIKGTGPWKCKYMGTNGEVQCAQTLEYRLP